MPTIHKGWYKARGRYECTDMRHENCKRIICPGDRYLRAWGNSDRRDRPTTLTICETCGVCADETL